MNKLALATSASILTLVTLLYIKRKRRNQNAFKRRPKRKNVMLNHNNLKRHVSGAQMAELQSYGVRFCDHFGMRPETFDKLLDYICEKIEKDDWNSCITISAKEKLFITLRYLATGMSFAELHFCYHLGVETISSIVRETCEAIWETLGDEYMPTPNRKHWEEIANAFWKRWNFPNCVGAVAAKSIRIRSPKSDFSRKGDMNSIILTAVADADYLFTLIDTAVYVGETDAVSFLGSKFGEKIINDSFDFPPVSHLPGTNEIMPYFFIGDNSFPIMRTIMKPFPKRTVSLPEKIFNCRLARARETVEHAFALLATKWSIIHETIPLDPEYVVVIVKAACVLHNYVRKNENICEATLNTAEAQQLKPEEESVSHESQTAIRCHLGTVNFMKSNRSATAPRQMRDVLAKYFSGIGAVPWQSEKF